MRLTRTPTLRIALPCHFFYAINSGQRESDHRCDSSGRYAFARPNAFYLQHLARQNQQKCRRLLQRHHVCAIAWRLDRRFLTTPFLNQPSWCNRASTLVNCHSLYFHCAANTAGLSQSNRSPKRESITHLLKSRSDHGSACDH